jgi:hypothetical protein
MLLAFNSSIIEFIISAFDWSPRMWERVVTDARSRWGMFGTSL